jgi:hypothetical protein
MQHVGAMENVSTQACDAQAHSRIRILVFPREILEKTANNSNILKDRHILPVRGKSALRAGVAGEWKFRIEIFAKVTRGQKGEFGGLARVKY